MTVKEEERLVPVIQKTYIAIDGTEFSSEAYCLDYERRLQESSDAERTESLIGFEYNPPVGSDYCHWALVHNEEELQSFVRYYLNDSERSYYAYDDPSRDVDLREFPVWIVALVDDNGNGSIFTAEDLLSYYESFTESVRKQIAEKMGAEQDDET